MKKAIPYRYYFLPVLFLSLLGIADTVYLAISHYKNFTDIAYSSFCAISQSINCDTVEQSSWSILLNVPVAIWGFAGYLLYISFLIPLRKFTSKQMPLWSILQFLGFVYSILAIVLGFISAKLIHAYCLMCLLSYGISFLLFFYPWIIRSRFYNKSFPVSFKEALILIQENSFLKFSTALFLVLLIGLHFFYPHYWIRTYHLDYSKIETGMTSDGHPWIGSQHPELTIKEFTDYQCFQCGKLHYFLRQLINKYPKKIRLIHYNFPLDNRYNPLLRGRPFHIGSGKLALLAIYASSKGKFWKMNDELYRFIQTRHTNYLDLKTLGKKLSLPEKGLQIALYSPVFLNQLEKDIRLGIKLGITATPSFVINGKVYVGSIPASMLRKIQP